MRGWEAGGTAGGQCGRVDGEGGWREAGGTMGRRSTMQKGGRKAVGGRAMQKGRWREGDAEEWTAGGQSMGGRSAAGMVGGRCIRMDGRRREAGRSGSDW